MPVHLYCMNEYVYGYWQLVTVICWKLPAWQWSGTVDGCSHGRQCCDNDGTEVMSRWLQKSKLCETVDWIAAFAFISTLLVGRQEKYRACKNLSDEVLVWLSVWSEVQIGCIWSGWCHCFPKPHNALPHLNPDCFYISGTGLQLLVLAYPGCPGNEAIKWM